MLGTTTCDLLTEVVHAADTAHIRERHELYRPAPPGAQCAATLANLKEMFCKNWKTVVNKYEKE